MKERGETQAQLSIVLWASWLALISTRRRRYHLSVLSDQRSFLGGHAHGRMVLGEGCAPWHLHPADSRSSQPFRVLGNTIREKRLCCKS